MTRVEAFDLDNQDDTGSKGGLIYEIVDGNVDGAFTMRSSSPGVVLTNTVLDREIRDRYELTIAAKDQGTPQLTGTAKVVVLVLDVNDSPLQFPALAPIKISKGKNHETNLLDTLICRTFYLMQVFTYFSQFTP